MIQIVQMTQEHIQKIVLLEQMCFSDPWSESAFASELCNSLSLWLVAISEDGEVAGYIGSQAVIDAADIMNIAVHSDFRQKGIGSKLIDALAVALSEKGIKTLTLEVRPSNYPALALYRRCGFHQIGLRKGYYRNPKEDAYILQKEI